MSTLPIATLVVAAVGLPLVSALTSRLHRSRDVKVRMGSEEIVVGDYDADTAEKIVKMLRTEATDEERPDFDLGTQRNRSEGKIEINIPKEYPQAARRVPKGHVMAAASRSSFSNIDHRIIMQILLSLLLVGASLYVVLAEHYDPNSKHWAFGTLGTIMGFWLRGVR
jgi:hypothetical protein